MTKALDYYMNDPDIADEPSALREVHAIRLMIYDETKDMTAEERTAYFSGCVKILDDGDILLCPREFFNKPMPNGLIASSVVLSGMGLAVSWFIKILENIESVPCEYSTNERTYRAFKNSDNVFLEESRGGFINIVGYSQVEIPNVLALLRYYLKSLDLP